MQLNNLGKVRESRRLRCITVGKDGKVYLMAGEISTTRPCQFYSYSPEPGRFETLGLLIADRSPYYYWRGQQFDCMTTGLDGTIYLGESERKSHLFLFFIFRQKMNSKGKIFFSSGTKRPPYIYNYLTLNFKNHKLLPARMTSIRTPSFDGITTPGTSILPSDLTPIEMS